MQIDADDGGSLTSSREVTLVVAVPSGDAVAALVHALRTGDVTVVRSTFADASADGPARRSRTTTAPPTSADAEASG